MLEEQKRRMNFGIHRFFGYTIRHPHLSEIKEKESILPDYLATVEAGG